MERRQLLRALTALGTTSLAVGATGAATTGHARPTRPSSDDWSLAWRTELQTEQSPPHGMSLQAAGDTTLITGEAVTCLDTATGRRRWRATDVDVVGVVGRDDAAIVLEDDGTLRALALTTGETRWETTLDEAVSEPPLSYGGLVLASVADEFVGVDVADGTVAWRHPHEGYVTGGVVADGVLYSTTLGGVITAIDATSGDRRWRRTVADGQTLPYPAVADGRVVVAADDGPIVAVTTDGAVAWTQDRQREDAYDWSVAAGAGRCFATRVDEGGQHPTYKHVALSLDDGTDEWTRTGFLSSTRANQGQYQPVQDRLTVADGRLWVVGTRHAVARSPDDGTLQRRWFLPGGGVATPLVTPDRVVLADAETVVALDRTADDCGPPTLDVDRVTYEFPIPQPRQLKLRGTLTNDGGCPQLALVEVLTEGQVRGIAGGIVAGDEPLRVRTASAFDLPKRVDEATLRVRGTAGTVIAEREVPIDDTRDDPASFDIVCADLDVEPDGSGTAVTVTLDVRNYGNAPGYVATLETNEEVVATTRGDIHPFRDDDIQKCEGTTVTLLHRFDEAVTGDLRASVQPAADEGTGDSVLLDSANPGALDGSEETEGLGYGPTTIGASVVAAGAVARILDRLDRDEPS